MPNKKRLKTLSAPTRIRVSRTHDASRGTPIWAYNFFRTTILTSLLNDLIDLENKGLDEVHCVRVQKALEYFTNMSTELPSGGFLTGSLHKEADQFAKLYFNWNCIEGVSEERTKQRRAFLVKLRKRRQKITDKARRLQFELSNDLDQQIVRSTYQAVGDVITLVPDLFKNLASSYGEYLKRAPLLS